MNKDDSNISEIDQKLESRKKTIDQLKDTKFPTILDRDNNKKKPIQKKLNRSSNSTSTSLLEVLPDAKMILEEENDNEKNQTFKHPNLLRDQLEFNQQISKLLKHESLTMAKTKSVGNLLPKVEEQKNEEEKKSIYHQRVNILKDFDEFNQEDKFAKVRASVPVLDRTEKGINPIEEVAEKEGIEKLTLNHQINVSGLGKSPIVNLKVDEIDEDLRDKCFKRFQNEKDDDEEEAKVEIIEEEHEGPAENVALEKAKSKLENDHEAIRKYTKKDTTEETLDRKENYLEMQGEIIEEQDEDK